MLFRSIDFWGTWCGPCVGEIPFIKKAYEKYKDKGFEVLGMDNELPDVTPDDEEFDLFVKEVARVMTVKAGQKCTAIRRVLAPTGHVEAVIEALRERLYKVVIGNPEQDNVRMGPVVGLDQRRDVLSHVKEIGRAHV